ncbi:Uncharacterised protein [Mycobacteroides abscessus subsp. massiliense]|uniref:Uncharacterized protein n=1 Tax=Mycobacteroides abscessus subsp. massiliense TaxID=1962118 RepID=A0A1U5TXE1_9MYCO|nr:hypothetical protein MMAS_27610 [Mycobacteroides abscessus subsp. massiliense CCUG 48898 = JCM 15300]MBE5403980.1 hypothetical protein [Mycobacteroides abscessus]SIN46528.1 Uncharacterised protein [Mycobacteroides abscessus subsp. bolletii]SKD54651.1 Uncharacterised protein [Mycobacteroides abscessus subsp. massiliense]MBE5431332.1 hypothetical protein [Mycobacteroides abscessus]
MIVANLAKLSCRARQVHGKVKAYAGSSRDRFEINLEAVFPELGDSHVTEVCSHLAVAVGIGL